MFRDERRYAVWETIRQSDLSAFGRLLSDSVFRETAKRAGLEVAQCALCGPNLIWLGIVAAVQHSLSFASVLSLTVRVLNMAADGIPQPIAKARRNAGRRGKRSQHDPRGKDPATLTEEAFVKARKLMAPAWWSSLIQLLAERFESEHAALVGWKRFRLLAMDGTTLSLPKGPRLAEYFGTSGNGKSRTVQARMVMLQLPLARLPWRYELSRIDEGERTIAARLLQHVRPNDLVLIDQGFWSYGMFHQVQSAGAFFGIRLYPHVQLRTIKRLSRKDRLVEWKKPTGPRWRGLDLPESITLRIIDYQIPGFRPSAVVTNVLDPREISRDEWVHVTTKSEAGRPLDRNIRLRQGLYHRRWEIETSFHEMKVTQKLESSLRSRTAESIRYEVAGHVVLYLLIRWLMAEAAHAAEEDGDPLGLSFKHAFEELATIWNVLIAADDKTLPRLFGQLLHAISKHRVPVRPGRHEPRPTDPTTRNLGERKNKPPNKLTRKRKQS